MPTLFQHCLGFMHEHRDTILRVLYQAHAMSDPDEAKYWRDRAVEVRRSAEEMHDLVTKRMMLDMAVAYDVLAQRAEDDWAARLVPSKKSEDES